MEEINNHSLLTEKSGPVNTYMLLGGQFIQSGVEKIYTYKSPQSIDDKLDELGTKIKYYKNQNYFKAFEKPYELLQYYIPNFDRESRFSETHRDKMLNNLTTFLGELFFAYEHNTSFPVLLDKPVIEECKEYLPIELYKPLEFLFSCMSVDTVKLPTIQTSIEKRDLRNFFKVVETKQYSEYSKSHGALDNSRISIVKSLKNIEINGKQLYLNNSKFLTLNDGIVTTLNTSAKLVDLFAGKFYGTISAYLTELLSNALKNDHRIVMYDCRNLLTEVFLTRAKKLL